MCPNNFLFYLSAYLDYFYIFFRNSMRLVNFLLERYFHVTQLGNFCLRAIGREKERDQNALCKFFLNSFILSYVSTSIEFIHFTFK